MCVVCEGIACLPHRPHACTSATFCQRGGTAMSTKSGDGGGAMGAVEDSTKTSRRVSRDGLEFRCTSAYGYRWFCFPVCLLRVDVVLVLFFPGIFLFHCSFTSVGCGIHQAFPIRCTTASYWLVLHHPGSGKGGSL